MIIPYLEKKHQKDFKRTVRRNNDSSKLKKVIALLMAEEILPAQYKDHSLVGNFDGFRECHIGPYWLLIYRTTDTHLFLARTGSHSDLF